MTISLNQLQALIEQFPQGKIHFDSPVRIKSSPHFEVFSAYGAWAHGVNGVWLLDGRGEWHQLQEGQANADLLIASINQRLRLLLNDKAHNLHPQG